jgi:cytochrome P450
MGTFLFSQLSNLSNARHDRDTTSMLRLDIVYGTTLLLMGGFALIHFTHKLITHNIRTNGNNKTPTIQIVPYANVGFIETIVSLGSRDAPNFLLKHLRHIQHIYHGLSCYRFFLPFVSGFCFYVVGDITTQRQILLDPYSDKDPAVYDSINQIVGVKESIFTSPNNFHWKLIRKRTSSSFSKQAINRMKQITLKHTKQWMEHIKQSRMQWNADRQTFECTIEPSIEMVALTFQIICDAAFECTDITLNDYLTFAKNLETALVEYDTKQVVNPFRPYFKWFLPEVQAAENASKELQAFAYQLLYAYRTNPNKCHEYDTLIHLIDSIDTISDQQKIAEILVFLVAGHDTTGYSIANTLTLLGQHPNVFDQLKEQTQHLLPEQWSTSCMYFTSIMKESFRYAPVAAFGAVRRTHRDFFVTTTKSHANQDNGIIIYKIPTNSTIFLPQVLSHRNYHTFGVSCDTFDPDRWMTLHNNNDDATTTTATIDATNVKKSVTYDNETIMTTTTTTVQHTDHANTQQKTSMLSSSSMNNNSNNIIPFAIGKRNCIGQAFAMTELETILPYILSQIDHMKLIKHGKLDFFLTWKYIDTQICISMKQIQISKE